MIDTATDCAPASECIEHAACEQSASAEHATCEHSAESSVPASQDSGGASVGSGSNGDGEPFTASNTLNAMAAVAVVISSTNGDGELAVSNSPAAVATATASTGIVAQPLAATNYTTVDGKSFSSRAEADTHTQELLSGLAGKQAEGQVALQGQLTVTKEEALYQEKLGLMKAMNGDFGNKVPEASLREFLSHATIDNGKLNVAAAYRAGTYGDLNEEKTPAPPTAPANPEGDGMMGVVPSGAAGDLYRAQQQQATAAAAEKSLAAFDNPFAFVVMEGDAWSDAGAPYSFAPGTTKEQAQAQVAALKAAADETLQSATTRANAAQSLQQSGYIQVMANSGWNGNNYSFTEGNEGSYKDLSKVVWNKDYGLITPKDNYIKEETDNFLGKALNFVMDDLGIEQTILKPIVENAPQIIATVAAAAMAPYLINTVAGALGASASGSATLAASTGIKAAVTNGVSTALQGGDLEDIVKGAAAGYVGGTYAPQVSGAITSSLNVAADTLASNLIDGSVKSALTAAVKGEDIGQAALAGAAGGFGNYYGGQLTDAVLDDHASATLTQVVDSGISTTITTLVTPGGDLKNALLQGVSSAAGTYVTDQAGQALAGEVHQVTADALAKASGAVTGALVTGVDAGDAAWNAATGSIAGAFVDTLLPPEPVEAPKVAPQWAEGTELTQANQLAFEAEVHAWLQAHPDDPNRAQYVDQVKNNWGGLGADVSHFGEAVAAPQWNPATVLTAATQQAFEAEVHAWLQAHPDDPNRAQYVDQVKNNWGGLGADVSHFGEAVAAPAPAPTPDITSLKVGAGDNLWDLAGGDMVSLGALAVLNGLDGSRLQTGQTLLQIDSSQFSAEEQSYLRDYAQALLDQDNARLTEIRERAVRIAEGASVSKGTKDMPPAPPGPYISGMPPAPPGPFNSGMPPAPGMPSAPPGPYISGQSLGLLAAQVADPSALEKMLPYLMSISPDDGSMQSGLLDAIQAASRLGVNGTKPGSGVALAQALGMSQADAEAFNKKVSGSSLLAFGGTTASAALADIAKSIANGDYLAALGDAARATSAGVLTVAGASKVGPFKGAAQQFVTAFSQPSLTAGHDGKPLSTAQKVGNWAFNNPVGQTATGQTSFPNPNDDLSNKSFVRPNPIEAQFFLANLAALGAKTGQAVWNAATDDKVGALDAAKQSTTAVGDFVTSTLPQLTKYATGAVAGALEIKKNPGQLITGQAAKDIVLKAEAGEAVGVAAWTGIQAWQASAGMKASEYLTAKLYGDPIPNPAGVDKANKLFTQGWDQAKSEMGDWYAKDGASKATIGFAVDSVMMPAALATSVSDWATGGSKGSDYIRDAGDQAEKDLYASWAELKAGEVNQDNAVTISP